MIKAILVDDETEMLEELKEQLAFCPGIQIFGEFSNPFEALRFAEDTALDCAFIDIQMPGMSGLDLAQRILACRPEMDIVFVTAYNDFATQAFDLEAVDYILKPLRDERLLKSVDRLLKARSKCDQSIAGMVTIHMLGSFCVGTDDLTLRWTRSKSRELLAYLLQNAGQKKNKYAICEALWPEYDSKKALVNLQTVVCSLRKILHEIPRGRLIIDFSEECYMLTLANIRLDTADFEAYYASFRKTPGIDMACKIIALWQGEYLEGEDWNWAILTADSYSTRYEQVLSWLSYEYLTLGRYQDALDISTRLLIRQPSEPRAQLTLLKAAYYSGGSGTLRKYAMTLDALCRNDMDSGMEPATKAFCDELGIIL